MAVELNVDVAIIGAGTAGLYALREVKRANKSYVLIDQGPLGTTCARVGCMPSKVALHAGLNWNARQHFSQFGISGGEHLSINTNNTWAEVKRQRDGFANGAAKGALRSAGEHLLIGSAEFVTPQQIRVSTPTGGNTLVTAKRTIVAVGSRPIVPAWLNSVAERVVTTDQLFELEYLPKRLGVLGLGAIGLEMSLALSRMGVSVVAADVSHTLGGIQDPEISQAALAEFTPSFTFYLGEAATLASQSNGINLQIQGQSHTVDLLLAALGRRSNLDTLKLENANVELSPRGLVGVNPNTLQVGQSPIYIVGDANGEKTLMHEAAAEGAIAGYNASHPTPIAFKRKTSIGIAFTDPDIITVGASFNSLQEQNILIGTALGKSNGRNRILHGDNDILRLYAEADTGRLLGASMLGKRAEHIAHLLALAIDRGETAHSLMEIPFYHPTVEEMLQSALQDIARKIPQPHGLPLGLTPL